MTKNKTCIFWFNILIKKVNSLYFWFIKAFSKFLTDQVSILNNKGNILWVFFVFNNTALNAVAFTIWPPRVFINLVPGEGFEPPKFTRNTSSFPVNILILKFSSEGRIRTCVNLIQDSVLMRQVRWPLLHFAIFFKKG